MRARYNILRELSLIKKNVGVDIKYDTTLKCKLVHFSSFVLHTSHTTLSLGPAWSVCNLPSTNHFSQHTFETSSNNNFGSAFGFEKTLRNQNSPFISHSDTQPFFNQSRIVPAHLFFALHTTTPHTFELNNSK